MSARESHIYTPRPHRPTLPRVSLYLAHTRVVMSHRCRFDKRGRDDFDMSISNNVDLNYDRRWWFWCGVDLCSSTKLQIHNFQRAKVHPGSYWWAPRIGKSIFYNKSLIMIRGKSESLCWFFVVSSKNRHGRPNWRLSSSQIRNLIVLSHLFQRLFSTISSPTTEQTSKGILVLLRYEQVHTVGFAWCKDAYRASQSRFLPKHSQIFYICVLIFF